MTPMPPNPWMSVNSEADNSHAPDTAAALADLGRSAAAIPTPDPDATDCINEIFWFVRNKLGDDRRAEDFVDLDALEQSIDPVPEFLTRRRA